MRYAPLYGVGGDTVIRDSGDTVGIDLAHMPRRLEGRRGQWGNMHLLYAGTVGWHFQNLGDTMMSFRGARAKSTASSTDDATRKSL